MSSDGCLTFIAITFCIFAYIAPSNGKPKINVFIGDEHDPYDTEKHKITCISYQVLHECEFKIFDLMNGYHNVPTSLRTKVSGGNSYYCDVTLDLRGLVDRQYYITTCRVRSATSDWIYKSTSLYKSEAPYMPRVQHRIEEGDNGSVTLHATCTVTGSRPAPEVHWQLDNKRITSDVTTLSDDWKWPTDELAVIVRLNLKLDTSHIGKTVVCFSYNSNLEEWSKNQFQIGNFTTQSTMTLMPSDSTPATSQIIPDVATVTTQSTMTPVTSDSTPATSQIIPDVATDPPPTTIVPDSTQSTSVKTTNSSDTTEQLVCDMNYSQHTDGDGSNAAWLYVVIVLASLLIILISLVVFYAWRNTILCFSRSNDKLKTPVVKYRHSINASVEYEETRPQTMSSVDRSSAVTGLEYAEIRVSMVQRCVDKMAANTSAETGEMQEERIRPNSLYQSFDEKL